MDFAPKGPSRVGVRTVFPPQAAFTELFHTRRAFRFSKETMPLSIDKLPRLITALPGPRANQLIERDHKVVSLSYTRDYPLVAKSGQGALVEDVDGNVFLDFAAGIAVVSAGHCHPKVVGAIQKQAAELIHMSCT